MRLIPIFRLPLPRRADVAAFIKRHEPYCVQLSASLRRSVGGAFAVLDDGADVAADSGGNSFAARLCGVISFRRTLLLCLPFAEPALPADSKVRDERSVRQRAFSAALSAFFEGVRQGAPDGSAGTDGVPVFPPACVNGCAGGAALVLDVLAAHGAAPVQTNRYDLMRLDRRRFQACAAVPLESGGQIVRFGKSPPPDELHSLLELQKAYEIEEVLPAHIPFDEHLCRLRLMHTLRTQAVYALRVLPAGSAAAPLFAAKAGTSADGFQCAQLGGVYTRPEFRWRQYGYAVVRALLCRILHEKKSAVLFVKKENAAAAGLYRKLGFQKISDYTIAYFHHNP
ncbi:MAG: GNAT family N-acetyltransferase [Treponemataceae bacterium]|nr:GNAT family N-acetyltransferase [Treponemataceae bacterium]